MVISFYLPLLFQDKSNYSLVDRPKGIRQHQREKMFPPNFLQFLLISNELSKSIITVSITGERRIRKSQGEWSHGEVLTGGKIVDCSGFYSLRYSSLFLFDFFFLSFLLGLEVNIKSSSVRLLRYELHQDGGLAFLAFFLFFLDDQKVLASMLELREKKKWNRSVILLIAFFFFFFFFSTNWSLFYPSLFSTLYPSLVSISLFIS